MAMIDYGAVAFKNGKQLNHTLFMDMLDAVGWIDRPRRRYPDCEHVDEKGFSVCDENCPRITKKTYHNDKVGDYVAIYADCRGNDWTDEFGKIDGNYYAYVGDEHLTVAVYKYTARIVLDKETVFSLWAADDYESFSSFRLWNRLSSCVDVAGVKIYAKTILPGQVNRIHFYYNGDYYDVVYGFGIDPNMQIWDDVKNDYLGKKGARKVDNLYRRIRSRGEKDNEVL